MKIKNEIGKDNVENKRKMIMWNGDNGQMENSIRKQGGFPRDGTK